MTGLSAGMVLKLGHVKNFMPFRILFPVMIKKKHMYTMPVPTSINAHLTDGVIV